MNDQSAARVEPCLQVDFELCDIKPNVTCPKPAFTILEGNRRRVRLLVNLPVRPNGSWSSQSDNENRGDDTHPISLPNIHLICNKLGR